MNFNSFHAPAVISDGLSANTIFQYGPSREPKSVSTELKLNIDDSDLFNDLVVTQSRSFSQNVETRQIVSTSGSTTETVIYISGPDGSICALAIKQDGEQHYNIHPVLSNHQGSITHILSPYDFGSGELNAPQTYTIVEERSYDPWGLPRDPETYEALSIQEIEDRNLFKLTRRGYTGHEHLTEHYLINMDGRLYDPYLGRMLSVDNYVQDPWSVVSYNRYAYCWNNPLKYTDPSGEIIFTAMALLIPGAQFLLPMAIQTDIGWITGGLNAVANGESFWKGAAIGGAIGAVNGALSMISPIKIPFGQSGFGLSIAPQLAVGTDGLGLGFNATLGYDLGKGFTAGINFGGSYYASATGTGNSGFEGRIGYGIGYEGKHFQAGIGSNYFFSGETSQQTGQIYAGGGKWKVTYENDTWAPVPGLLQPGGAEVDKYRTAGLQFDVTGGKLKGAKAGFKLFTGASDGRVDANGNFREPGNQYRMGALYVGYNNYRLGYNSERNVRAPIQNGFHDLFDYPHFGVLNRADRIYGGYYSTNPYTLW